MYSIHPLLQPINLQVAHATDSPPSYVRSLEEQVRQLSAAVDAAQHASPASAASPALSGLASIKSTNAQGSPASQEVHAINKHTRNVEFYGSSSSLALLSQIHRRGDGQSPYDNDAGSGDDHSESEAAAAVLLSNLHNPSFSPGEIDTGPMAMAPQAGLEKHVSVVESTHFRQSSVFLHNFFSTIHYIHPILDKTSFLERSEVLWSGDEAAIRQQATFVPLYYSVLSLGALVGYRDMEPVGGVSNQQWSRKFFNEARAKLPALEVVTSIDLVQCFFFLVSTLKNRHLRVHARTRTCPSTSDCPIRRRFGLDLPIFCLISTGLC